MNGSVPEESAVVPDGQQTTPSYPPGRKVAPRLALAGAAIAILAGVLVFAFVKHENSTGNVRVIVPAPAAAGGLHRDYADERSSQFLAAISGLHQRFAAASHGGSFGAAIYTNAPAGSSAQGASLVLVYIGFNAPSAGDPARNVRLTLSGVGRQLSHSRLLEEGGGRGDTSFACETGTAAQRAIVACAWGTDRTVGLLIPQTPAAPAQLAAVLRKMEPDLVRG